MSNRRTRVHAALPQLLVTDVRASAGWYERILEMRTAFTVGDPPTFALVAFAAPGQAIHLAQARPAFARGNRTDGGDGIDAYVRTTAADVDRRVGKIGEAGGKLSEGPVDQPWKMREIGVVDLDGHVIIVGGDLTEEWPAGRQQISPQLMVADLDRSLAFFRDVLRFRVLGTRGEPPTYAMVERDGALVHLGVGPTRTNGVLGGWDVYFECGGIDAVVAELQEAGARIVRPLGLTAYNMRELEIEDPDGHRLAFAEPPGGWDDHPL